MVSLGFLTMALFALLAVQTFGIATHDKLGRRSAASLVASSLVSSARESLRQNFEADVARPRSPSGVEGFEYRLDQTRLAPDLQQLKATVFWTDDQGAQEYRLATRLTRP